MKNFDYCAYTYRHRKIIVYLIQKLIHDESVKREMLKRAENHDMDKILLYQVMEPKEAQDIHVKNQPHHLKCEKEKTDFDWLETILDYESAPYTKPDKPLNAYDFTMKMLEKGTINEAAGNKLLSIMHELGIDFSGTMEQDEVGKDYAKSLENVTEEMILEEMVQYVKRLEDVDEEG